MMTATTLFALARGLPVPAGSHRCFYCLAPCTEKHPAAHHVKKSFTSRDTVGGGNYVCGGCVAAMDEKATVTLPDGTVRHRQKVRCYSWIVTENEAIAATKSHRKYLFERCLNPPLPPFVICISDSGQKHLLYRSAVCHSQDTITISLEAEPVSCRPVDLEKRVLLCNRLSAAIGKPALTLPLTVSAQIRVAEYHQDESLVAEWLSVQAQPLSRLAIWFALSKKEAESEIRPKAAVGRIDY